jgi:hypothetical protein
MSTATLTRPGRFQASPRPQPPVSAIRNRDNLIAFLRGLSVSQWLLLLLPIFLYAVHRQREAEKVDVVDASAVAQIAMTGLCAMHVLYRCFRSAKTIRTMLTATPLRWLFIYGILAIVSVTWSGMPSLTAFRSVQFMVYLLLLCDALAATKDVTGVLRLQIGYALIAGVFWELVDVSGGLTALHSSMVPGLAVGAVLTGWLAPGRSWRIFYAVVVLICLVGSSSGAFLAIILGVAAAAMLLRGRVAAIGCLIIGALIVGLLLFPQELGQVVFYGKSDQNIQTASGRVPVWQELIGDVVDQHPFLGFGFAYGEVRARLFGKGFKLMHMHSAAMSALMNLGAVGVVLLLLFWGGVLRGVLRMRKGGVMRPIMFGAVIAVMVNSLAMESITAPLSLGRIGHLLLYSTAIIAAMEDPLSRYSGRGQG